jgi:acyl-homoserine-lactone acylase
MKSKLFLKIVFVCVVFLANGAFGQEEATSPWAHASLYRDEWGVPHVYAEDPRSMAFVFGYAQAEDHLEAMLASYRFANGRAAEVFGEAYAQSDEFSLKIGHAELARNAFESIDPLTRDLCEGFAMGVNAWIVEHPDLTPPWADGAKPQDILSLLHCYLMSMAPFDLPDVYHQPPASFSGNAWAIAPPRTDTGETFLVINPHTNYGGPFLWYEAHLVCDDMNVAGGTLFGLPVILQGHNEVLGWALTPNMPDFGDIYIEQTPGMKKLPKSVNKQVLPAEEKLIEMYLASNMRTYNVLTNDGLAERSVPCLDTPHGPIVSLYKGRICAYLVGGYHDFGAIAQLMEMARSRDLDSFKSALSMQQLPCFNVVYADKSGNIFYLYNTKVGDKFSAVAPPPSKKLKSGIDSPDAPPDEEQQEQQKPPRFIDWTAPVQGSDSACSWGAILPVETLPSIVNPASGYLQACGSPPWLVTDNSGLSPDQFPAWFAHDVDSYRAQRVRRLLSMGKRSFRDCQSMLYDIVVPAAVEMVPRLLDAAKQRADLVADTHPDLPAGLDILKSWNFLSDAQSTGMTFFHSWWTALENQNSETYPNAVSLMDAMKNNDEEAMDLALDAATEAARTMRNEFDSLSAPWGDVHTITRGDHEYPIGGATSGDPIFVADDNVFEGRKWRVTYGYGFAMAIAFGDVPRAVSMSPFGSSENPKSPHFSDQLELMQQRRFKVSRFLPDDVQRNAVSAKGQTLFLRPRGMDAAFKLSGSAPFMARLNATTEAAHKLPEDFTPFTLFISIEKAPHSRPVSTHMEIFIPNVLCSSEDLDKLAIFACGEEGDWKKLEAQQLVKDARMFIADDTQSDMTYAVLGPVKYRATRLEIPEDDAPAPTPKTEIPIPRQEETDNQKQAQPQETSPETPQQTTSAVPEKVDAQNKTKAIDNAATTQEAHPAQADASMRKSHVSWGVPPRRKSAPIAMPEPEDAPATEVPKLQLSPNGVGEPAEGDSFQDNMKGGKADRDKLDKKKAHDEKRKNHAAKKSESTSSSSSAQRNFSFGSQKP